MCVVGEGGLTHFCSPPSHKDKLQRVVFSQNLLIAQNVHLKNVTKVKVGIKRPTPPTATLHVITLQSIKNLTSLATQKTPT